MEKIRLNKSEKLLLRSISMGRDISKIVLSPDERFVASQRLRALGLIDVTTNYDEIIDIRLTCYGRVYLANNPNLRNPIDWKWIIHTIFTAVVAGATVAALFIGCSLVS